MGGAWEAECDDGYDGTKRDARGGGGVGGELECGLEREGGGWNTEALWPFCGRLSQGLSFRFKIAVRMQRWVLGSCTESRLWKAALARWGWEGLIGIIHTHGNVTATKKNLAVMWRKKENERVQKVVKIEPSSVRIPPPSG
jgi:hypothetical protein